MTSLAPDSGEDGEGVGGGANLRSVRFRADVFARSVKFYVDIRRLSVREAAVEMGVSPATVSRVTRGYPPDLECYFRMRIWLEIQRATAEAPLPSRSPLRG